MLRQSHRKKTINHIGLIMDGNGRWAFRKGFQKKEGHKAGIKRCINLLKNLSKLDFKIKNISLFVFSTENWKRPPSEIRNLFKLIEDYYSRFKVIALEEDFKIKHLGSKKKLSNKLKRIIEDVVLSTKNNKGVNINLAFNYGSRQEILDAFNNINSIKINEKQLTKNFYIPNLSELDLIIRTGGELRLSNFLLWQSAYAELFFTKTLWPNFTIKLLNKLLVEFNSRNRNYGK